MGRRASVAHVRRVGAGLLLYPSLVGSVTNPEDFPNLLAGTFTDGQQFSTGNTLPLVARPWGFNHWSMQTNDGKTSWWFRGDEHTFTWLRLTHQPSPWIGDWAWLLFGPQMGNLEQDPVMFIDPWGAKVKPYTIDAMLGPDNMRIRLSPTDHGAVLKVTFPEANTLAKRLCFRLPPPNKQGSSGSHAASSRESLWMEMTSTRAEGKLPPNFGLRVHAKVDVASLRAQGQASITPGGAPAAGSGAMRCFEFSPVETDVTVWIGTSLISMEQARLNLKREVEGRTFEDVELESRLVWRSLLNRLEVVDPGPLTERTLRRLTIFYSGLYRALTFPRRLDEVDANGKRVHYSPYDPQGRVFDGVLCTDNGFWDTFRTVYPLLALGYPAEAGEIVTGWLNAFKEGGWLPEWSSPGYRDSMVGTFADVIVADALLKDVPGVDPNVAWDAINKDSFTPGQQKGGGGKQHYHEYVTKGYLAFELGQDTVSSTLDYAFSDFAVSAAATKLGKGDLADRLRVRAINAREHMFDRHSGLMLPKSGSGNFRQTDPTKWGAGYVEGSAWQHSFPPFDLPGLAALHGSREALARKIRDLVESPGTFHPGSYGKVIHEMEEMRALGMGQYSHNNQPAHHILWLLLALDGGDPACSPSATSAPPGVFCPRLFGESAINDVVDRAYGLNFFAGDEDNGEMGAWYVLTALGLYDAAPGTNAGYTLGSPLFRRVDVHRSRSGAADPPAFSIRSAEAGREGVVHIQRVFLGEEDVGAPASGKTLGWMLPHAKLVSAPAGTVLRYVASGEEVKANGEAREETQHGDPDALRQQIQQLEHHVHELTQAASDHQVAHHAAALGAQATNVQASASAEVADNVISDAPKDLQPAPEEHAHRAFHFDRARQELEQDDSLHSTLTVGLVILVVVNVLGWLGCMLSRGRMVAKTYKASTSSPARDRATNGKKRTGKTHVSV